MLASLTTSTSSSSSRSTISITWPPLECTTSPGTHPLHKWYIGHPVICFLSEFYYHNHFLIGPVFHCKYNPNFKCIHSKEYSTDLALCSCNIFIAVLQLETQFWCLCRRQYSQKWVYISNNASKQWRKPECNIAVNYKEFSFARLCMKSETTRTLSCTCWHCKVWILRGMPLLCEKVMR